MKSLKQFGFAVTLALTVLLTSCSGSDDNGGGGGSASLGTLKAKVGGNSFTSMEAATFATKQVVGGLTTIIIQGSTASGKAIQLILTGTDGNAGTFEISDTAGISAIASYTEVNISNPMDSQTWAAPYESSGVVGSITISEITETNVKGTFNFTAKNQEGADTKSVTNGAFNINFTSN
ncbi:MULTISPECIES: DUF6252 family protein [Flavobacterium]|uniref:DUF6252 family protein n=1 Tax=Flavobacterium sedimenticola TaxID=3043286 RepID=A0ABT6XRQ3_9FLAO|nr:DUF6252 family protein [Flavobacterium sedimenticola]MDI9257522.1 DUF6252 family protein [Flavobacterium sedimenticola]